jgi:hypothetical protein
MVGRVGWIPDEKRVIHYPPETRKKYINEIRIRPNKSSRAGDRVGRIYRAGRVSRIVAHP